MPSGHSGGASTSEEQLLVSHADDLDRALAELLSECPVDGFDLRGLRAGGTDDAGELEPDELGLGFGFGGGGVEAGKMWSESTAAKDRRNFERDILPELGDVPITVLSSRPEMLRSWAIGLTRRGLQPSTVRSRKNLLGAVFAQALLDGLINRNPADAVNVPPSSSVVEDIVPAGLFWRIRSALPVNTAILVDLQLGAGLRIGEAVAVRPDDLDDRNRLRIERQGPDSNNPAGPFRAPKSSNSVRTIPVDPMLADTLREHVEKYGVSDRGTLVANSVGGAMTQKRANSAFARARNKAGIVEDVTPQDMRAHWITSLLADGVPVDLVARYAGHTIQTLEKHYRRWIPDREAEFAAAVEGYYAELRADCADSTRTLQAA